MHSGSLRLPTATKLAIARVIRRVVKVGRVASGLPFPEVLCTRRGVRWSLDLDEGIQLALYLGMYERATARALQRLCPADGVALDIGANVGAHALPFARSRSASGFVVAIEPADGAYARLCRNIGLNPALGSRLQPIHQALRAPGESVEASYYAAWPLVGRGDAHAVHHGVRQPSTAGVSTLDALVKELRLRRLDVIKLDVDGNDLSVLRGGVETMARFRPAVVFEFSPHSIVESGERPEALLSFFEERGYMLSDERTLAPLGASRERFLERVPFDGGVNLVARVAAGPAWEQSAAARRI